MSSAVTVGAALALAREFGIDRLDAQLLVAHVTQRERTWVLAHDDAPIDGPALERLIARRAAGEPLAYLVGEREFHGLMLRVTPEVLVPRPDTETLVDWALELLAEMPAPSVVDLGTGSGAIALAVKHDRRDAQVHAVDRSAAALAVARDNARRLGLDVEWHQGDWWTGLPSNLRLALALSNPPYVAPSDPHLSSLTHEPRAALVPEGDRGDGLADIDRVCDGAPSRLLPGGWILIEHGATQGPAVRQRLQAAGLDSVATRFDLESRPRVSGGRRPG